MAFLAALPAAIGTLSAASTATAASVAAASATLAETSALIGGVGAAFTGYSAYKQSQFQAQVAKNNAIISANNHDASLNAGVSAEANARLATGRRVGAALAAQAANGVDVGYGAPAELRGALSNEGELDALTIRHNAASDALAFAQQSAGFSAESSMAKRSAVGALVGAGVNVGASYIGGASSSASRWATYKQLGIGG